MGSIPTSAHDGGSVVVCVLRDVTDASRRVKTVFVENARAKPKRVYVGPELKREPAVIGKQLGLNLALLVFLSEGLSVNARMVLASTHT